MRGKQALKNMVASLLFTGNCSFVWIDIATFYS